MQNVYSSKTDNPDTLRRTTVVGRKQSVSELLAWCFEQELDPDQVFLTGGGHLTWDSPITQEERERRDLAAQHARERQEQWERQTYERLKGVYG